MPYIYQDFDRRFFKMDTMTGESWILVDDENGNIEWLEIKERKDEEEK